MRVSPVRAAFFCLTAVSPSLHSVRRAAAFYAIGASGTGGGLRSSSSSSKGGTGIRSMATAMTTDGQPMQECVYQDGKPYLLQVCWLDGCLR